MRFFLIKIVLIVESDKFIDLILKLYWNCGAKIILRPLYQIYKNNNYDLN